MVELERETNYELEKNKIVVKRKSQIDGLELLDASRQQQNIELVDELNSQIQKKPRLKVVQEEGNVPKKTQIDYYFPVDGAMSCPSQEQDQPPHTPLIGQTQNYESTPHAEHRQTTSFLKSNPGGISNDESISDDVDDEVLRRLVKVTDSVIAKKIAKVSNEIARYNIIFLPENNKNDPLRFTFIEEWKTFENFFVKTEDEIMTKISPPLKKVENVLNEYQKALKNATEWGYVELDSVFIDYKYQDGYKFRRDWLEKWVNNVYERFLTCFQLSRHVLNDESSTEYQYRSWIVNLLFEDLFLDINSLIRFMTGEVENKRRKNQKNLSKLPEDRQQIGWYHDGILSVNINGVEEYVGILEVVGNSIVEIILR